MRITLLFILLAWTATNLVAQTYLFEDFEGGVPNSWTSSACWISGDSTSISSTNLKFPDHTNFVAVNDDRNENAISIGDLVTPLIDLTNANNVIFSFDFFFLSYDVEEFSISVKANSSDWEKYPVEFSGCTCWRQMYLDLSKYKGNKINIRFEYSDGENWNYGVGLDNIKIVEAKNVGGYFYPIDPISKRIDSKYEIDYKVGFCSIGSQPISSFEVNMTGGDVKSKIPFDHISFFDSIEVIIPDLEIGKKYHLIPTLTKDDQVVIESAEINFQLFPSIYPFRHADTDGNVFDIYESLQRGETTLLYFTTTWCGDCKDYVSKLNTIQQTYPDLNIISIYLDEGDTDDAIKNLNLEQNFPSHSFSVQGVNSYILLSQNHESTIPFTVLICPNEYEPEWSQVIWSSDSWGPGTSIEIEANINSCRQVTNVSESTNSKENVQILPNPSNGLFEIELDGFEANETELEVFNLLGQLVFSESQSFNSIIALDLSHLKGLYLMKIKVGDKTVSQKIEIY